MDYVNYLIVGSGPAGVAAARRLERGGACIVDVGEGAKDAFCHASFQGGLEAGDVASLLGSHWEMLANLVDRDSIHTKLRAPGVNYVASGEPFKVFDKRGECTLNGRGSYAAGGMSNAWGSQLFRYTDKDLNEAGNWPFGAAALEQFYSDLESHIGIAGEVDDMHDFLGETACMLPPVPIVPAAEYLLSRYRVARKHGSRVGLRVGRSRLAVLTTPYRDYEPHQYGETEFFSTEAASVYTARRTLKELVDRGNVAYFSGHELVAYQEYPDYVEIKLHVKASNSVKSIRARHLLLGCGTLHTARLVLLNRKERSRKLPFIDHPPTLLPVFIPAMFGSELPAQSFPVQLVATLDGERHQDMISFYYPGALLWSDLLADMPMTLRSAIKILPNLLGGMLVAQIWEPSRPVAENCLSLEADGSIRIDYPNRKAYAGLQKLVLALRRLGAFALKRTVVSVSPGWGFHYAACLPMRQRPGPYETHIDGRLWDSRRVRIIDGSVLPSLPAKNHSLTLMANAARIADEAFKCGY